MNPADLHIESFALRINLAMQLLSGEKENIAAFLDTVEMAHTVGPFIDPTLYRDQLQRGDMDALAAVCRSLREPIRVWDEKMAPRIPA